MTLFQNLKLVGRKFLSFKKLVPHLQSCDLKPLDWKLFGLTSTRSSTSSRSSTTWKSRSGTSTTSAWWGTRRLRASSTEESFTITSSTGIYRLHLRVFTDYIYGYLQITSTGIYRLHLRVFTGYIYGYLQVTSTGIYRLHRQVFTGYIYGYLQVTSSGIYRLHLRVLTTG